MDSLECCKQHDGPVTAKKVIYRKWDYRSDCFFWRGKLHLTSDWNTMLGESSSNLLQGALITSDKT